MTRRKPRMPKTVSRRKPQSRKKEQRGMIRLVLCAAVFVSLVLGKILLPSGLEDFRQKAASLLDWNIDLVSAFSSIGRAVSGEESLPEALDDVYVSVFGPTEVVETSAQIREDSVSTVLLGAMREGEDLAAVILPLTPEVTAVSATVTPLAMESSYVYTQENLPSKVSMNQKILGLSFSTPAQGRLTSGFGYRIHPIYERELFHYGIDIANDSGSAIMAFADGTVSAVGESSLMGKYLILQHKNGVETLYAHCQKILVSSGAVVSKGDTIALMGSTGMSTGPHLHFEIHKDGVYLNPIYYVDPSI